MTIKITKNDVKEARKAKEAALKKNAEFRAHIKEIERMTVEEMKQQKKENK